MSINWDNVLEEYNKATETLSGYGIIVHSDGTIEHSDEPLGELESDCLYEEADGTWSYDGQPLSDGYFTYNGVTFLVMHSSEVPTAGFLQAQYNDLDSPSVFFGASMIMDDEDSVSEWFFARKAL